MRRSRKMMLGTLAVAMPLGFMAAVVGPTMLASAGSVYYPVTCAVNGTISYNPILSFAGVTVPKGTQEVITVNAAFSGCVTSNWIGGEGTGSTSLVIKTPATKVGVGANALYYIGQCESFGNAATLKAIKAINGDVTWNSPSSAGPQPLPGTIPAASGSTQLTTASGSMISNYAGESGFYVTAKYTGGDYPVRSGVIAAYVDGPSITAIAKCIGGGPSVMVSNFDPATSTASL